MLREPLNALKETAERHLEDKFGLKCEKTKICFYDKDEWAEFCNATNAGSYTKGLFSMRDLTAHLLEDTPFLKQNFFHDYFGHGLYAEHSMQGRMINSLEKRFDKLESKFGKFKEKDPNYQLLKQLEKEVWADCEGFAMWMEHYLSGLTGNASECKKKFEKSSIERNIILENFINYSKQYGEDALLFSIGFPKRHDKKTIENVLKNIFSEDFDSIKLGLVYGSRKPYSDIDLFLVSDRIKSRNFNWLDVYSIEQDFFEDMVRKLDISITDALFSGSWITGSHRYFNEMKHEVLKVPITQGAIDFHKVHSHRAKELALMAPNSALSRNAMRYNLSYLLSARELEQGRKPLTLNRLKSFYPEKFVDFEEAHKNIAYMEEEK